MNKKSKITKDLMFFEWGDEPAGYVKTWRRLGHGDWEWGPVIRKDTARRYGLRMECPFN